MAISSFSFAAVQSTQITMAVGASIFTPIVPIQNQVGLAFYAVGVSGKIEISGGGQSYAPAGVSFNFINANGSSIGLKANGTGFPVCEQANVWPPQGYVPGAPYLWLSAGFSCILNILYYTNNERPNQ